jgi:hypothetical protein
MKRLVGIFLICLTAIPAFCQSTSKYQVGTITEVRTHQTSEVGTSDAVSYDVSVKVGDTIYVVLYTPPSGVNTVEYARGTDMLFLVGADTLTFNSQLSGTTTIPIIRREAQPAAKVLDWSKAPGEYFSMKQRHLSETLDLSDDQQRKIKPTLEQESGEVSQLLKNPVLTRNEKLSRFEKIVRSSDAKIRPLLSPAQVQKLLELRREQKEDVKTLIAEENRTERH